MSSAVKREQSRNNTENPRIKKEIVQDTHTGRINKRTNCDVKKQKEQVKFTNSYDFQDAEINYIIFRGEYKIVSLKIISFLLHLPSTQATAALNTLCVRSEDRAFFKVHFDSNS